MLLSIFTCEHRAIDGNLCFLSKEIKYIVKIEGGMAIRLLCAQAVGDGGSQFYIKLVYVLLFKKEIIFHSCSI